MQDLTPELLAGATARLLAQLPQPLAMPSEPGFAASGFSPMAAGTPMASSFPAQPSSIATPANVSTIGTPTRPSETPAVPRVGFPTSEIPASFLPPVTSSPSFSPAAYSPLVDGLPDFSFRGVSLRGLGGPDHASSQGTVAAATAPSGPDGAAIPTAIPAAAPPVETSDGLKAFINRIRAGNFHDDKSRCGHDDVLLNRLRSSLQTQHGHQSRPLIFDVNEIRRDFPILHQKVNNHDLVWFDNAATTQKPNQVINAISYFYSHDNSNIHRAAHTLAARATDAYEGARKKIQNQLGASSPEEIIFVRGTTEGINLVAQTFGRAYLQPGDEIVLTEIEHHANIVPWQLIAKERGAVLKVVPVNDRGEVLLGEYQKLLGPKTRVVALTHASNSLGTIVPAAEMTHMARRVGAKVLIDGAQSVSHMPINVNAIGCDFFVFSGHKIFGPTGIGAVYIRRELQEGLPPWQGGGNMIRNVTFEATTYSPPPAKFEAGTPNIADAVGLGAALDYVNQVGLHNIGHYEHSLLQYGTERLSMINGLRIIGTAREKVSVISFVLGDMPPEKVGQLLDKEGIAVRSGHHCAQPSLRRFGVEATVRPSFAFYNTVAEIDHLVDVVRRIQKRS